MLNARQSEALELALKGHSFFLNGQAGTGKTFVMKEIVRQLLANKQHVAVTCTTGIACRNYTTASTLHRWAGLYDGRFSANELKTLILSNEDTLARVRSTEVLFIDEISMLSKSLFDKLSEALSVVRINEHPFGGIQIIVAGDFNQLPPVPNKRYNDSGEYCFESEMFKSLHKVSLHDVIRQKDLELVRVIDQVSRGTVDHSTIEFIKALSRPLPPYPPSVKLFATNDLANNFNRQCLTQQPGTTFEYAATDTGERKYLDEITAQPKLWFKENVPVVLIRNLSSELVNGLSGVVRACHNDGPDVYFSALNKTVRIRKVLFSVYIPNDNRTLAKREQVPLLLAYALTVHKAHGMTLDKVEVDCQQIFKPGQLGVAMGRVRSKDGLRVINFSAKVCFPQPPNISEYISTENKAVSDDLSCCSQIIRPTEDINPVWFEDEMEVAETEDDLNDELNESIARIDVGTCGTDQLPDGFQLEAILKSHTKAAPVTETMKVFNNALTDLGGNNFNNCKTFCVAIFKELSKIMDKVEAMPGVPMKAEKLTEMYAEISKFERSENYKLLCLLLFVNQQFSPGKAEVCRAIVGDVRKFLLTQKVTDYEVVDQVIHERTITDASRARVRYVAGYCLSSINKTYSSTFKNNMFEESVSGQEKYIDASFKKEIVNRLTEDENYLQRHSKDKESLFDIDRRQYVTRGLVNVTDAMFQLSLAVCEKSLHVLNADNLNTHGETLHAHCLNVLQDSEDLRKIFTTLCTTADGKADMVIIESEEMLVRNCVRDLVLYVNSVEGVFRDFLLKFLNVMFNQFRKDVLHTFSVAKTMAHRKQILVSKQKKEDKAKGTLTFGSIQNDYSDKRERSHGIMKGMLLGNIKLFHSMPRKHLDIIGQSYGIKGKQSTKKQQFIDILKNAVIGSNEMPNPSVFSKVEDQTSKTSTRQTSMSTMEEPLPSTSTGLPSAQVDPLLVETTDSSDDELCVRCLTKGNDGVAWIQCNKCNKWYHRNCAGLRSKKAWEKYTENVETEFICNSCKKKSR